MMKEYLPEFGEVLGISGFRRARIEGTERLLSTLRKESPDLHIQIVDAKKTAGIGHLRFAALNAINSVASKTNVSESLAVEILLYASARRQIKDAIDLLGVTEKTTNLAVIAVAHNEERIDHFAGILNSQISGIPDDSVLEEWDQKEVRRLFNISEREIQGMKKRHESVKNTISKLVCERMAILSTVT